MRELCISARVSQTNRPNLLIDLVSPIELASPPGFPAFFSMMQNQWKKVRHLGTRLPMEPLRPTDSRLHASTTAPVALSATGEPQLAFLGRGQHSVVQSLPLAGL